VFYTAAGLMLPKIVFHLGKVITGASAMLISARYGNGGVASSGGVLTAWFR